VIVNFEKLDNFLIDTFKRYGTTTLRISLGVVFLWFGFLKFFPNVSPAETLATRTIDVLTFGLIIPSVSVKILAAWESLIGLGLLTNKFQRVTLFLLWSQMVGAWSPLVIFPNEMFISFPFVLTLEGQYIVKNLVIIAGSFVLAGMVRNKNTGEI